MNMCRVGNERLNAFTAGCLLALMAIPTIFTLAEDAINNIPRTFTEASLAVGASKLQTTLRIIVPSALSGIISAIMLGFGRVIGVRRRVWTVPRTHC